MYLYIEHRQQRRGMQFIGPVHKLYNQSPDIYDIKTSRMVDRFWEKVGRSLHKLYLVTYLKIILPNTTRFAWSHFYSSELSQYKILSTPLDLLGVRHISSQILTNQEPVQLVQRNFSHLICLESFSYIGRNWQEIFQD